VAVEVRLSGAESGRTSITLWSTATRKERTFTDRVRLSSNRSKIGDLAAGLGFLGSNAFNAQTPDPTQSKAWAVRQPSVALLSEPRQDGLAGKSFSAA